MAELRECPFCGGEAYTYTCKTIRKGKEMKAWIVHCRECWLNYPAKDICYTEAEAVAAWNRRTTIETNIYDKEEIYPNCTVQVLTNTVTGEVSVGWWKNGGSEPTEIDFDYGAED